MKLNRVIIIGNGFDLSHGLKTSYPDFLKYYLKRSVQESFNQPKGVNNPLFSLQALATDPDINKIDELDELFERLSNKNLFRLRPTVLFNAIRSSIEKDRWVDFESLYYKKLVEIANDKRNTNLWQLNNSFSHLSSEISNYISQSIMKELDNLKLLVPYQSLFNSGLVMSQNQSVEIDETLIINFNYTNTINLYKLPTKSQVVNIHGQVNNEDDPIILGYGDTKDQYFDFLKNHGEDEYTKFLKSYHYHFKPQRQLISAFQNNNLQYHVDIVGHSCGRSDAALLNKLLEHDKCKSISLYHYKNMDHARILRNSIARLFNNNDLLEERLNPFSEEYKCPNYI